MTKLKVWLVVMLVFGAGFVAGVVTTRVVVHHIVMQIARNPNRLRDFIEKRMTVRLRLDARQRAQVDEILQRRQADLVALRGDFAPRFRGIMSNAETEISAVLTAEQRERFQKFREQHAQIFEPVR
jgi:saccharopine dehydrogenase-like NADP-dependent oxidoreductase